MVIELFELLGLLPNIFTDDYCFWKEDKIYYMNRV